METRAIETEATGTESDTPIPITPMDMAPTGATSSRTFWTTRSIHFSTMIKTGMDMIRLRKLLRRRLILQRAMAPPPPQEAYPENYVPAGPYPGPNEEPSAGYRPAYQDSGALEPPATQPPTTLVFQDGRPTEQVHNYVLTKTTLYDLDANSRKDIPLADLNLPATIAANRSAGVAFSLPASY